MHDRREGKYEADMSRVPDLSYYLDTIGSLAPLADAFFQQPIVYHKVKLGVYLMTILK